MKKKQIAFNETFLLYVYVPFIKVAEIMNKLSKSGYACRHDDLGNDHKIVVEVTPDSTADAVNIIKWN